MAETGSLFDLSPEDFEFTLKELDLDRTDPARAKFLRDEYVKQTSLAGQMKGAFEEATSVPEGRERATILPMTKPEGMTGWEAIKSGEAELALPGFLADLAEEGLTTLTTGEKMRAGIGTTEEEVKNAALTLGMSSLAELPRSAARSMSSGVDTSVVSSGGAKPKGPRQVPTFNLKGQQSSRPDPRFGTKEIKDIFEEDKQDLLSVEQFDSMFLDEEDWSLNLGDEYDVERLGYARNIPVHELAQIKIGNKNVEDVIDYYGSDPNPDTISYINSRLARLDNDPEFNDYVTKLRDNPDFDPNEALYEDFTPSGLAAEFRSPILETVSQMDYPRKGIEGYQLISALQKNPSIRKAELDTVLDDIDPNARYSKEDITNIVNNNTWITTAEVLDDNSPTWVKYGTYQRQRDLLDPEEGYFELVINSRRATEAKPQFSAKNQHFSEDTLAHSRASVRTDERRGDNYVLVEELQTDLLQHGFDEPVKGSKAVSPREAVQQSEAALEDWGLTSEADRLMLQIMGEDRNYAFYADTLDQFINEVGPEKLLAKPGATVEDVKKTTGYYEGVTTDNLLSLYSNYKVGYPGRLKPVNNDAWDIFDSITDFYWNNVSDKIRMVDATPISAPPIKKVEESVKLTLNALIAEADKRGVDRIVIPPLERIVDKRFNFGTDDYKKAVDKSSGFYKTYVKSLDKAIKELEDEFGRDKVSKSLVDMNYVTVNLSTAADKLTDTFGWSPDSGWEEYLNKDFHRDLKELFEADEVAGFVSSDLLMRDVANIQKQLVRTLGINFQEFFFYAMNPYKEFSSFVRDHVKDLPRTGTEINIKGLRQEGYDLSRPRFAEGGLVKDNPIWQHHQMNVDNDTYVKNEDGSISTVYTTIIGDGEREYLIPKVWDGKILSDEDAWDRAMSSGIDWPSAPTGEEGIRQLEQLDEKLHKDMRGYAEGGEVLTMDRQMRTFMAEGGLKDDGMNIDPVSGNEIPPGSMAEEVRDDISAQLSEGEYVVPADVVKYFGVKFFEELRSEAKAGLGQMEANGRIGGEPVPAGGPRGGGNMINDVTGGLTVEEMAQLEAVMTQGAGGMNMAVGGVVPQQYGMPMAQPQYNTGMMQQGMQVGGMVKGYKGGGLEQEMETVQSYDTFDPSDYSLGYSFRQQEQQQTFVMLYGPNGEVVSLMLPRDQAEFQRLAAQGYTTEQPGLLKEEEEKKEEDVGGPGDPYSDTIGQDLSNMSTEDIQNAIDSIQNNTGMGKITNAISNSILGKAIAAITGKTIAQQALEDYKTELSRRGQPTSTTTTTTSTTGTGFESRDTDSIGRDFSGSGLSMGEDFSGDGRDSTSTAPEGFGLGKSGSGISTAPSTTGMSMGETDPGDGRGTTGTAPEGFGIGGGGEGPSGGSSGGTSGGGATGGGGADSGTGPSGGNASPGASGAGAPGVAGGEVGAGPGGTDAVGPMNKGGLATKRRKPKRNTANTAKGGLASPK